MQIPVVPEIYEPVLTELGLPEGDFLPALVAFNVGVELGQLAVSGLALLRVGACARK